MKVTSRKPYLLRALVEHAEDHGLTALVTALVDGADAAVQVPDAYVKDGYITLNISQQAMNQRVISNDTLTGFARFGGRSEYLELPIAAIQAFMVRETGEGMSFPEEPALDPDADADAGSADELFGSSAPDGDGDGDGDGDREPPPTRGRPHLRVVK